MAVLEKSVVIDAPLETVFAVHEREDALTLLSPRFPRVRVLSRTGGIAEGARVELRVGGLRWVAVHTAYEKNRYFVDEQAEGPFVRWVHRHEFDREGAATRLTDRVEYQLRGAWMVGFLVKFGLERMLVHRHAITKRICEGKE